MSETSELEMYVNRAMLIAASDSDFVEKRASFAALLESYRARLRIELMDEGLDALNEDTFRKLRAAEGQ